MSSKVISLASRRPAIALTDSSVKSASNATLHRFAKRNRKARRKAHATAQAVPSIHETTPTIFPCAPIEIYQICMELDDAEVQYAMVDADEDAEPHNPWLNVARRIAEAGGRPLFGRRFFHSEIVTCVQFHVLVESDDGTLTDVTPTPDGCTLSAFVADRTIPPDFPWTDRPKSYRFTNYVAPSREDRVARALTDMPPAKLAHLQNEASALGMTCEDMVAFKLLVEPLETAIAIYIDAADELDAFEADVATGDTGADDRHLQSLRHRKATLAIMVDAMWTSPARDATG